jgi:hypothetical protein
MFLESTIFGSILTDQFEVFIRKWDCRTTAKENNDNGKWNWREQNTGGIEIGKVTAKNGQRKINNKINSSKGYFYHLF